MIPSLLSLLAAAVLAGVDQLIKHWTTAVLEPVGAMQVWPGVVELRYYLNDGMAFSMLAGQQTLLIAVTTVMLAAVAVYLVWKRPPLAERIAWTMVLGGGIGNLIDRVLAGQVVDYINLLFIDFAVFNFADICVTCGIALLFVDILLVETRRRKAETPQTAGDTPAQEGGAHAADA